jgi:hypothetical protein
MRVGVPGEVEPGTCPPLAVMGRRQQAIDDALVRVGRGVGQECRQLFGGGRKADEIERDTPEQRAPRRFARRTEPVLPEPREHERVDGVAHPGPVSDGRRDRTRRLHVRPVLVDVARRVGHRTGRHRRALVDPRLDERDLRGRQRILVERHPILLVGIDEPPVELAAPAVAGTDGRAGVPALEDEVGGMEPQARPRLGPAVAFVAGALEDGLDVPDVVDRRGVAGRLIRRGGKGRGVRANEHGASQNGGSAPDPEPPIQRTHEHTNSAGATFRAVSQCGTGARPTQVVWPRRCRPAAPHGLSTDRDGSGCHRGAFARPRSDAASEERRTAVTSVARPASRSSNDAIRASSC